MNYLYSGPTSGVTLNDGEKEHSIMFITGSVVVLPPDHEYTKTLIALKHLTSVPEAQPSKKGAKNAS